MSYIPYSFMWEGVRYVTLVGAEIDDYLELTEVVKYKNAMPWAMLHKGNVPAAPNLETQSGKSFTLVPMATAESFEESDGYYLIKGTDNGKMVELTRDSLIVDGAVICGNSESSYPVEQEEAPEVETETEPQTEEPKDETAEHESQTQQPENEPKQQKGETEPESASEQQSEETVAETKEPENESEVEEMPKASFPDEYMKLPEDEPKTPEINQDLHKDFVGFSCGSPMNSMTEVTVLGAPRVDTSLQIGVELHVSEYTPAHIRRRNFQMATQPAQPKTRYPWQRVEEIPEAEQIKPEMPHVESGTPTVVEEPASVAVEKAWTAPKPEPGLENQWKQAEELAPSLMEETKSIAPEAPVTAAPDVNKELKEAFRSTLTPEVNHVIGDIPHTILGNIEAWSSNDVDLKVLEEEGDIYCINRRWQKCGKWYCIDLINKYTRYFYNSKLGVSIEIPVSTCKEWLRIVGGNN